MHNKIPGNRSRKTFIEELIVDSFSFHWGKNEKNILKWACHFFYSYLNETKKSTANSYNLISCYFLAKSKGKQLWNKTKFKLIPKLKNKLTNGHGGMIIQLRAVIFEKIRNELLLPLKIISLHFSSQHVGGPKYQDLQKQLSGHLHREHFFLTCDLSKALTNNKKMPNGLTTGL